MTYEIIVLTIFEARFPRVTRERDDKTWATATSLAELRHLYTESKNNIDVNIETRHSDSDEEKSPQKRRKQTEKEDFEDPSSSKVNYYSYCTIN